MYVLSNFAIDKAGICSVYRCTGVETLKVEMESVESGLIDFKDKYKKL